MTRLNRLRYLKYKYFLRIRHYRWDPENPTFWDWLNEQDMHLARWEVRGASFEDHDHMLAPLSPEETEAVLGQYLAELERLREA